MATTQENIGEDRDKPSKGQTNSESIHSSLGLSNRNVDNVENQVSNGIQSNEHAPGIAKVGNTGAETSK